MGKNTKKEKKEILGMETNKVTKEVNQTCCSGINSFNWEWRSYMEKEKGRKKQTEV